MKRYLQIKKLSRTNKLAGTWQTLRSRQYHSNRPIASKNFELYPDYPIVKFSKHIQTIELLNITNSGFFCSWSSKARLRALPYEVFSTLNSLKASHCKIIIIIITQKPVQLLHLHFLRGPLLIKPNSLLRSDYGCVHARSIETN